MAALCNRAGHIYFHPVVCSSSFFFSSPNLSGWRLDNVRLLPDFAGFFYKFLPLSWQKYPGCSKTGQNGMGIFQERTRMTG